MLQIADAGAITVNDVHSQLNATRVAGVARPRSIEELQALVRAARDGRQSISVAGGRHAMGGQQFGDGTLHLDMTAMGRVLALDAASGTVTVEAGIAWPELIEWLVAANIHGRGLTLRPFVQDVESLVLVDADGEIRACSRAERPDLFRLAIGGYGLFGVVAHVTLRLRPRRKVERRVTMTATEGLMAAFDRRVAEGFEFGDFQFAIDAAAPEFMRAHARRPHALGGRVPPADRSRPPLRRELLSDVPSLGAPRPGRSLLPAIPRVPAAEAALRPRRPVRERLVPALPRVVRTP